MRGSACVLLTGLTAWPVFSHPGHEQDDGQAIGEGSIFVAMLENEVRIEVRGGYRYVTSNGIPEHTTGQFPTRGNPNRISAQSYRYRLPLEPEVNSRPRTARGTPFGIALNGVPFDPGTAEIWTAEDGKTRMQPGARRPTGTIWNYDALSGKINLGVDENHAHVQPTGAYHYHGIPTGLVDRLAEKHSVPTMTLVGYAADGFPVYSELGHADADDASSELKKLTPSYRLKEGARPDGKDGPGGSYDGTFTQDFEYVEGLGDLDECNGRTGVTPEYPEGTYYYVLTDTYPFIPRMFMGDPDDSFSRRGPRNDDGQRGARGGSEDGQERRGPRGEDDRRRPPPRDGDRPPPRQ